MLKSKGFAGVKRTATTGYYCLTPAPGSGIDGSKDLAVAGVDMRNTAAPEGNAGAMNDEIPATGPGPPS
jgi:hypothetical protein